MHTNALHAHKHWQVDMVVTWIWLVVEVTTAQQPQQVCHVPSSSRSQLPC